MRLAIGLALRDDPGLDQFLAQVYNPASPAFHRFLTPKQFTERFGPTEADYAQVLAFARASGFVVAATHANRLLVDVAGSAGDIQRAFHITLRTYHHPTEARDFFAPDTEPSVALQLPVVDVSGLNNFALPRPKHLKMSPADLALNASPRLGSAPGGGYMGNDFRAAYLPDVNLTGAGQMLGLVQFDGFYDSDIAAYETAAGLPAVPIQTVLLDGYDGAPSSGTNDGNLEVSLDLEMAISMAPGLSNIIVFTAGPNGFQNDILNAMAASNQVKQLSCSWGWPGGPSTTTDAIFKLIAAQGQSFFNASGDSDAFAPGQLDDPLGSGAPSSSPFITQVGGTTLTTSGPGGNWLAETVWNWGGGKGTGGGISSYYPIPSWQTNVSMATNGGSTTRRNIPDVALTADNVYVRYGKGKSGTFGGTSCATPLWGALAALMNQQAALVGRAPVGFVNPALYALGQSSNYLAAFHDINTGNNTSSGSPTNFFAVPGYDLCTGWGTPAGQGLIDALTLPPDPLGITPTVGFVASGEIGGPFTWAGGDFLLTNFSASNLTWSVGNTSTWLNVSATTGLLVAGSATNLSVGLEGIASNLDAGIYGADLLITNEASLFVQRLSFLLNIGQSLVLNGGFEEGDFSGWTLVGDTVDQKFIYNAVEDLGSTHQTVHSGSYGAFLGDAQLATLSQVLATVPGRRYLLSLWLDNPKSGSGQLFAINWNTNASATNTIFSLTNPPVFTWTNLQFLLTATATNTVLQFAAENLPNYFGLDDVSVLPVPAPTLRSLLLDPGTLQFSWNSTTGVVYQVQSNTLLDQTNWLNLGEPVTATNSSSSSSDSITNELRRFYRVIILP